MIKQWEKSDMKLFAMHKTYRLGPGPRRSSDFSLPKIEIRGGKRDARKNEGIGQRLCLII